MGGWLSAHLLRKAERQQGSPSVHLSGWNPGQNPRLCWEKPQVCFEGLHLIWRGPPT